MIEDDIKRIKNEIHKQAFRREYAQFVICPFGQLGQYTKEILNNQYGIQEVLILDNHKSGLDIKPIKWLQNNGLKHCDIVLLVAGDIEIRRELKEELLVAGVSDDRIIDLLGVPRNDIGEIYWDYRASLAGVDREERIFRMKAHNVQFWLPYYDEDFIQKSIFRKDAYYEENLLVYVTKFFKAGVVGDRLKGGTVLDIGANIGNHSLYYAIECCAGKVIAFEPVDETFVNLKKNVELNGLNDTIEIYNLGVGERRSKARLKNPIWRPNIGAATLEEVQNGNIDIVSIDDIMNFKRVDLIKIDVEGMECEVIRGALETINRNHPFIVLESLHDNDSWRNDNIFEIIKMLSQYGYFWEQISKVDYLFYVPDMK
jgi:FkbM family methyltransferase